MVFNLLLLLSMMLLFSNLASLVLILESLTRALESSAVVQKDLLENSNIRNEH